MQEDQRNIELEQHIDAYIKGRLSEDEVHQLWLNLLKKPEYLSLLETEMELARFYKSGNKTQHNLYYWKWIASTAAVIALVLAINFLIPRGQKGISRWKQGTISLVDNLASANVTRSAGVRLNPADSLLNQGFKAAISGQKEQALGIYHTIVTRYGQTPSATKAYLNRGILYYNSGTYQRSIDAFQQALVLARKEATLQNQAYWYLGNAYINLKQYQKARNAIQKTYTNGTRYQSHSFKLLKWLDFKLGNIKTGDGNHPTK